MKLTDYLHNSSTLKIKVDPMVKYECITADTTFSWKLTFHLGHESPVYTGEGDSIHDRTKCRYDGEHYEDVKEDLIMDLRRVLIHHVIDMEL